jgi:hypothetical protein
MLRRGRGDDDEQFAVARPAHQDDAAPTDERERKDDGLAVKTKTPGVLQREITKKLEDGSITLDAQAQLFQGSQLLDTAKFPQNAQEVSFPKTLQQVDPNATFHGTIRLIINASWEFDARAPAVSERTGTGRLAIDTPLVSPRRKPTRRPR